MSRIGTGNQAAIDRNPTQGLQHATQARPSNAAVNLGVVQQVRSRLADNFKIRTKKTKHLTSATEVADTELQALAGRKRDQMVGELTRLLSTIQKIEEMDGEDETSRLCTIMLREHIRRLLLVDGIQTETDELKGSA
ncbi:MAG: hypothetical protein AAF217_00840 [Pseudomonadota bacterium]